MVDLRRFVSRTTLAAALVLAGCAAGGGAKSEVGENAKVLPKAATPSRLVAFTGNCPVSQPDKAAETPFLSGALIALASAGAPWVIEGVITAGANFLDAQAVALSASSTATGMANLYKRNTDASSAMIASYSQNLMCLIFIRGGYDNQDPGLVANDSDVGWRASELKTVNDDLGLKLISVPEVYAEFAVNVEWLPIRSAEDAKDVGTLFTDVEVRPNYLYYRKIGTQRRGDGKKNLLVDMTLDSRSIRLKGGDNSTYHNGVIDLGEVAEGTILYPEDFVGKTYPRSRVPQPERVTIKDPDGRIVGFVDDLIPTLATISLTETEKGGDIERAVAEKLREEKAAIAKALATPLIQAITPKKETASQ